MNCKYTYSSPMSHKAKEGLRRAIEHFGGVAGLADALGVERQAIYMWRGKVPKLRAYQIESLTDGQITAAELLNGKAQEVRA